MLNLTQQPHRRLNPLTGEWVLVSPHRSQRPWQGQVEATAPTGLPPYDPACYLCPGNQRARGARNPGYTGTFVFDNDFPSLVPGTPPEEVIEGMLVAAGEPGVCRVVCFSPRHDLTLAGMLETEVRLVVETWIAEQRDLGARPYINYVQIFENRGEMMGCSNPHPHGQIWASGSVPHAVRVEQVRQAAYREDRGICLLCECLAMERERGERVVCENESFTVVVPFWAVWPFETMVLPRKHAGGLDQLDDAARDGLAGILRRITAAYDRLFGVPFPYSMGFHQAPSDGEEHPEWHLHAHFHPPLLRSATVRKFLVGYEMLAMPQRDLTPEAAAERLRAAAASR